ncbi:TadA family conjugal transfer-associated ATPase, partial [Kitasatospora sp. NPDC004240]
TLPGGPGGQPGAPPITRAERQSAAGRVRPGARGPGACGPGPTASADPGRTTPEPPPYGRTAREERTAALVDAVRLRLAESGAPPTDGSVAAAVRASRPPLGGGDVLDTVRALRAELVGAGPLDGLLAAPDVTDVLVNGPDEVWIDRGGGLQRVPEVRFADADAVRRLAHRLATAAGRRLDDARPWVDARLPDGTRLHAVLPPIAAGCTHISLRVCRPRPFTLDELVAGGALPPQGAEILACVLRARLSLLISGGTGTGKTTLLAALLGLVGPGERIVLAEDSAELRPDHPHVVRLQSRPPNQEGLGELTLRDLVRQALRMRPDRLVIGEVRGAEVSDLLAALNTGHEGGCGTVHANRAADVPVRLEALGALAGLDRTALHSQLRAALDVVVHVVREPGPGRRRVAEIHVLGGDRTGLAVTTPAVTFTADGSVLPGAGWERLTRLCAERGVELPRIPASREPEDAAPRGAAGFRVGAGPRGCAGFIGGAGCAGGGKFTGGGTGFGGARFGGGGPGRGGDGPGTRGGPR